MIIGWSAEAQTISKGTVAEVSIALTKDSTATVLEWFKMIESKGIVLAYNASSVDLSESVGLKRRTYTLDSFLKSVLYRYQFEADYSLRSKVLLQFKGLKNFILKGSVVDQDTHELLEGATVILKGMNGKTFSTLTDSLGVFMLKLPYGRYHMGVTYIGYNLFAKEIVPNKSTVNTIKMAQTAIPLKEVKVTISPLNDNVNYRGSRSKLSVNGNDPFAQLASLPGISGSSVGGNLYVNGGQNDENLILLDGVSIYHSHHNNTLLSQFNGETVKKISFYDSFIPAQYEGRLSSVTDVRIKEGDSLAHHQTIGLDLPSASFTLDGPILKNKLTYLISGRHSWIDFMKDLFSDAPTATRTFNDLTGKIAYHVKPNLTIEGLMYRSKNQYNDSINGSLNHKLLEWENSLYSLSLHSKLPRSISNTTTLSYSEYENTIFAPVINIDSPIFIGEAMKNMTLRSNFSKKLDEHVDLVWGLSLTHEKFKLLAAQDTVENTFQNVTQFSSFFNTKLRITEKLYGSAALNLVSYLPQHNVSYFSVQPRFTLSYVLDEANMFSLDFSRMEQFYHSICLGEIPLPTDLRMPSVDGFKPSSSMHSELGWRHINAHSRTSISAFYKRRFDILGIRYNIDSSQQGWNQFIMNGNACSYGIKMHMLSQWNRWLLDLSYTYSRSYEWFREYENNKKIPTLHDIPHMFNCAASYQIGKSAFISMGGYIKSGIIENLIGGDFSSMQIIRGRRRRKMNYRLDLNFENSVVSKNQRFKLDYKVGLYNIVGNPKRNEIIDLYSVETTKHCLPYFTLNLKF